MQENSLITIESEVSKSNGRRNQYIGSIIVSLNAFCAGTVLAWTSPALGHLLQPSPLPGGPGFTISVAEEAVTAAILFLGAVLSSVPSGKCADVFGRKITSIIIAALYATNFILIACARDVIMLVVARFLAGVALGGSCVVSPMYVGEIAEESLRGVCGAFISAAMALGVLYTNIIGSLCNWVWLEIGLVVPAVLSLVSLLSIPDTPVYFVLEERMTKAKRALVFFRQSEKIAIQELGQIQRNCCELDTKSSISALLNPRYRKVLIAGLGLFAYQQFCGLNLVIVYMVPIFEETGGMIDPHVASVASTVATLAGGIAVIFIIERRKRKYFLILSAVIMLSAMLGLGLFFRFKRYQTDIAIIQFLPLVCVFTFLTGFSIGLAPVPWILLVELYGVEIRGVASGVLSVVNWLAAFIVTFTYPHLVHSIGNTWTFYLYAILNIFGVVFIRFVVPETKLT